MSLLANYEKLSLQFVISSALEYNLGMSIAEFAYANAEEAVEIEAATFDTELFGSVSLQERQSAAARSTLDSAQIPKSEGRLGRLGIEKRFSMGTQLSIGSSIDRSASNNNAARNPDYGANLGLSVRQPLLKGAWRTVNLAPLARARVSAERSLFVLRSDVLDILLNTEIAYWNLAYARADRALVVSSLELANNLLDENRERERLGLVTPLEVLQAEAELLNRQEDVIQTERAIEDAQDKLLHYMGRTNFIDEPTENISVFSLPDTLNTLRPMYEVVRDTLASDVNAKAQERRIEVERINAILAQDASRSDVDLKAGLTYLGRDDDGESAYYGAYNADGYDWSIGLEVRMPWGFRLARASARKADRNLEIAKLQLFDIKQDKALAARNAWRSAEAGLKRIEVTRAAVELNKDAFLQERARYVSGLVAYRNVLEAQRDFDRSKRSFLRSFIETLRSIVRLSRIDGTLLARNGLDWNNTQLVETQIDPSTPSTINTP